MKTLFVKTGERTLELINPRAIKDFQKVAIGELIQGEYKIPRSQKFHRLYFALLNIMFENQDKELDFEKFRKLIMYEIGEVEVLGFSGNNVICIPKSISFSEMEESEFSIVYEKTLELALKSHFKGADRSDIEELLHSFI